MTFEADRTIAQLHRAQQAAAMLRAAGLCGYLRERRVERYEKASLENDEEYMNYLNRACLERGWTTPPWMMP